MVDVAVALQAPRLPVVAEVMVELAAVAAQPPVARLRAAVRLQVAAVVVLLPRRPGPANLPMVFSRSAVATRRWPSSSRIT